MNDLTLAEKLDPRRFSHMSPKMAALVAYVLGDEATFHTEPAIAELIQLSDGGILARHEGDIGANEFVGHVDDFTRNWGALVAAAELTPDEIIHVHELLDQRVSRRSWGRSDLS